MGGRLLGCLSNKKEEQLAMMCLSPPPPNTIPDYWVGFGMGMGYRPPPILGFASPKKHVLEGTYPILMGCLASPGAGKGKK